MNRPVCSPFASTPDGHLDPSTGYRGVLFCPDSFGSNTKALLTVKAEYQPLVG